MPQFPESLDPKSAKPEREVDIEWQTISYRTIWTGALIIVAIILGVIYFIYSDKINKAVGDALGSSQPAAPTVEQRQARFLNIDGTVRVKKANSTTWVAASPNLPLEKGDVLQCGSDGQARVSFADGSVYDMKPDTLIVVEENSSTSDFKTANVSVQVTSGEVDLSTAKFEGESKVKFADAVARIGQDSRANVRTDPTSRVNQLTMKKGTSDVLRGTERMTLGAYDQVSFEGNGRMNRIKVMQPPTPLMPSPGAAVIGAQGEKPEVTFTWSPVPAARNYRLRVSSSSIFSTLAMDRRLSTTTVKVNNLPFGTYYWAVTPIDDQGKEGQTSDAQKFDLVKQSAKDEILLEIDSFQQQGNQIEIVGRTEPNARVMVNDQPVFAVQPDGSFKHFTQPLSQGANQITVTAQNAKGKIATRRKTVYIQ